MKKIIIANWKLNPSTVREAERLAKGIVAAIPESGKVEIVIAPPFVFLESVAKVLRPKPSTLNPNLGAQDVFWKDGGAYTGEVSSPQLKSLGVKYVIVGHSERRALGETDEIVNKKVKAALTAGLKVILCVGEPPAVRRRGPAAAKRFVRQQLSKNLYGIKSKLLDTNQLIVTYEPIWAISSVSGGKSDTPEDALKMIQFIKRALKIRNKLEVRVLYGGSVDAKNAKGFLRHNEIGGALVGGASLKAEEFVKIVRIASKF